MLETAICIIVVLLVIGALIDLGLGLWQYNYLSYITNRSAREISARLATTRDCSVIESFIENNTYPETVRTMAVGAQAKWSWCLVGINSTDCLTSPAPYKSLRLVGRLPLNCYFLCTVVPRDWSVTATSVSAIENPDAPVCKAGGPVP